MRTVFVTGMGRSGTSLLDKLLSAHNQIDVLTQPLPLLFIDTKERFLKSIGKEQYFVLNQDELSRDHTQSQFDLFLADLQMDTREIQALFKRMRDYSGQKTSSVKFPEPGHCRTFSGFCSVLSYCLSHFSFKKNASYIGLKEIMCEEFLPYLLSEGCWCIVIVRDPRDVLASANYPSSERHLGAKKPSLFWLRTWRKSIEYIWALRNQVQFQFIRYEDLVADACGTLNNIAKNLELPPFEVDRFAHGVTDRAGVLWHQNTSRNVSPDAKVSPFSVGRYRDSLSDEEIKYTEAICGYEMKWLGYNKLFTSDSINMIRTFEDYGVSCSPDFPADFSHRPEQVEIELQRLEAFKRHYQC